MLAFEDYSAEGTAETNVKAAAIPRQTFDDLVAKSSVFRKFVFSAYSRRITDLFTLIDDIVFLRKDVRLAAHLLELADETDIFHSTHAMLGTELATARKVISRNLSEFHHRGWIELARSELRLIGRAGLRRLVKSAGAQGWTRLFRIFGTCVTKSPMDAWVVWQKRFQMYSDGAKHDNQYG